MFSSFCEFGVPYWYVTLTWKIDLWETNKCILEKLFLKKKRDFLGMLQKNRGREMLFWITKAEALVGLFFFKLRSGSSKWKALTGWYKFFQRCFLTIGKFDMVYKGLHFWKTMFKLFIFYVIWREKVSKYQFCPYLIIKYT